MRWMHPDAIGIRNDSGAIVKNQSEVLVSQFFYHIDIYH